MRFERLNKRDDKILSGLIRVFFTTYSSLLIKILQQVKMYEIMQTFALYEGKGQCAGVRGDDLLRINWVKRHKTV